MRRRIQARYNMMNGGKLVVACVLSGVLIALALGFRAYQTGKSDARICEKVDRLTNAGLAILNDIPDHDRRVHYQALYRGAACDANNLPSVGGTK